MSVLRNAKHERFAQALAKGETADQAYVTAGYTANRGNAARLKANEDIRKRVGEIRGRISEKAEWSAADRLKMLQRIAERTEQEDPRVAVSAAAEANKMQGSHAPARHQHSGPGGGPIQTLDLTNVSDADLERLEAILGPLAGAAGDDADGDPDGEGEAGR